MGEGKARIVTCPSCGVSHIKRTRNTTLQFIPCPECKRKIQDEYNRMRREKREETKREIPRDARDRGQNLLDSAIKISDCPDAEFRIDFAGKQFPMTEITCMLKMGIIPMGTELDRDGTHYRINKFNQMEVVNG